MGILAPVSLALGALVLLGGACWLPAATRVDGTGAAGTGGSSSGGNEPGGGGSGPGGSGAGGSSAGGGGAGAAAGMGGAGGEGGAGGAGGGPGCTSPGVWPDSTVHCSDGAASPCPEAFEDGSIVGTAQSYTTTATVHDDVTGLDWETTVPGTNSTYAEAALHCSTLGSGWHVPSLRELVSIVDWGRSPTIPAVFSQESMFFWTSSPHVQPDAHWGINLGGGTVAGYANNLDVGPRRVRCARGCLAQVLSDTGTEILDSLTGLLWQKTADPTPRTWTGALSHCETLGSGFRLPSVKELVTLFDPTPADHLPPIFPAGEPQGRYWSSTPTVGDTARAFGVDFGAQTFAEAGASDELRTATNSTRCVKDP
ncbi:MAG: DUF1566 domain-containing protein [Polyangiaceae bacterium]|nr:DUF1566 domain-containing protein [Polyangiaceae bacterium]